METKERKGITQESAREQRVVITLKQQRGGAYTEKTLWDYETDPYSPVLTVDHLRQEATDAVNVGWKAYSDNEKKLYYRITNRVWMECALIEEPKKRAN